MRTQAVASKTKTIWIDLDNSPHVPFFMPIIARLKEMGFAVEITARNCFQVCGLANRSKLKYRRIGKHYGKNIALKAFGTLFRAIQLLPVASKIKPDVAISHGSRAMNLAARTLNITTIEMTDYEFARDIPFIHPALLIAPEVIAVEGLVGGKTRVAKYPGIKEDVYVPFFKPDGAIKSELGIREAMTVVTVRPPATEAHYHNPQSEVLFAEVLNVLSAQDNVQMIILPRNEITQTAWIQETWPHLIANKRVLIPNKVVDGLNLIWHSDFVVSGGGTMNREAAALGVPVYSIFRGKIGAVDRYLESNDRLTMLTSKEDVRTKIQVPKRAKRTRGQSLYSPSLEAIIQAIDALLREQRA